MDNSQARLGLESKPIVALFLVSVVSFIFISRMHYIHLPLDRDEGMYAYIAQNLGNGMLPYRDTFDHKPPGIYILYAAGMAMFGQTPEAIRLFTTIYVSLAAVLMFFFIRANAGITAAYLSAAFFALYQPSVINQGVNSNTEMFISVPLIAALWLASWNKRRGPLLSGAVFFAACMVKQTVMPAAAAFVFFWYFQRRLLQAAALFAAGFLAAAAASVALLYAAGILGSFIESTVRYNFQYMKLNAMIKGNPRTVTLFFVENALPVLLPVALAIARREAAKNAVFLSLLAASLLLAAGIMMGSGIYPHYYLMLQPALAALAGVSAAGLAARLKTKAAAAAAAFLIYALTFGSLNAPFYRLTPGEVSHIQFGQLYFTEAGAVADRINSLKGGGSGLFVWGGEPELYFLTKMKAPGRYASIMTASQYIDPQGVYEALREASSRRPEFLVADNESGSRIMDFFPGYTEDLRLISMTLYTRAEAGGRPAGDPRSETQNPEPVAGNGQ